MLARRERGDGECVLPITDDVDKDVDKDREFKDSVSFLE